MANPTGRMTFPDTDQLAQAAREGAAELGELTRNADAQIRAFVEEKPLVALGGALVAGYLIGRMLNR